MKLYSPMDLNNENFTRLLNWLDPDRDAAGQEYVRIQADLAKRFTAQNCKSPDKLADITMDRVAGILTPEKIENWQGEKIRLFYRVAFYVLLESKARKVEEVEIPPDLAVVIIEPDEHLEGRLACLDKCVEALTDAKRELIIKYYRGKKADKIKNRRALARKRSLSLPVLRVTALRIRKELKICIEECLRTNEILEA